MEVQNCAANGRSVQIVGRILKLQCSVLHWLQSTVVCLEYLLLMRKCWNINWISTWFQDVIKQDIHFVCYVYFCSTFMVTINKQNKKSFRSSSDSKMFKGLFYAQTFCVCNNVWNLISQREEVNRQTNKVNSPYDFLSIAFIHFDWLI